MKTINPLKFLAISLVACAVGSMIFSCDEQTPEELCTESQAEYEANYLETFGTSEGLDYSKYTWDSETEACAVSQGVEG